MDKEAAARIQSTADKNPSGDQSFKARAQSAAAHNENKAAAAKDTAASNDRKGSSGGTGDKGDK
ncbi:hypothetical protein MMC14_001416 [Varicellaria rhodocarpa]|nr:hypothetical protein [Varicellaria rhodocarpa]